MPDISLTKAVGKLIEKLNGWFTLTVQMLPNLFIALIIFLIILRLRHPLGKIVERTVVRVTGHRHIARLFATIARLVAVGFAIFLALNILQLDRAVASVLAGVGILGIALGFASQDITANFMAGVVLHFEHPFRLGDRIKSGEFLGYVDSLSLRSTVIRGRQGERITIPNKELLGKPITNFYLSGHRRVDLYIGIDYTPDLQQVEELALEAVRALDPPLRNPDRPVEFFYEEVKETTVVFRVRFWVNDPDQPVFLKARSEAIKAVNQTFKDHGITMPSGVVTLDFGITGGVSLREQLEGVRLSLSEPVEQPAGKGKTAGKLE